MKVRESIRQCLRDALADLGWQSDQVPLVLERPRDAAHGDMSTPVPMMVAKRLHANPIETAERIAAKLSFPAGMVDSVEVAKPGFVNFRLSWSPLRANLLEIVSEGDRYGSGDAGRNRRVLVEYVSANPTGPLVIVSARAGAVGSAIVNLLRFTGHDVEAEYYVNDYGGQVAALGESFRYRLRERFGMLEPGEQIGAYPGEYLRDIAAEVPEELARRLIERAGPEPSRFTVEKLLAGIEADLEAFGVKFDRQFRESSLHPSRVADALRTFVAKGITYERDGAVHFRSSELGDDKDRVLEKSGGDPTYFLSDIAYHQDKLERGFHRAIDLLGPDHHGHVARMKAAMSVLGAAGDWLEIIIIGWVRLMEGGRQASMSKRKGEFVTLRELIDDVGADVAKYFFLMRRANTPLDFDLTLARTQSDENPVFYVQYAHARISSVVRFAREKGYEYDPGRVNLDLLTDGHERELMVHLFYFANVVANSAESREPHRLTAYAQELATAFHQFYHECRIVSDDSALTSARLLLCDATRQVLKNTLTLLGVSAPTSM